MYSHAKGKKLTLIGHNKRLCIKYRITIEHISEQAGRGKCQSNIREPIHEHRPSPLCLIVGSSAKTIEGYGAEDNDDEYEDKTELGLVDAFIFPSEVQTDGVAERTRTVLPIIVMTSGERDARLACNTPMMFEYITLQVIITQYTMNSTKAAG
jgi:hypothetical protein